MEQEVRIAAMPHFFGKYRGSVVDNVDPQMLGRIRVAVPEVLGNTSSWALPCVPYAGPGVGLVATPPIGASVWVEFEAGDATRPICTGGFWGPGEMPAVGPETHVLKTAAFTLTVCDAAGEGGVTLELGGPVVAVPLRIAMTAAGLELAAGGATIRLAGPTVTINDGALEVT